MPQSRRRKLTLRSPTGWLLERSAFRAASPPSRRPSVRRQAVEETRVDHQCRRRRRPLGRSRTSPRRRPAAGSPGMTGRLVLAREIQVALVAGGTAEDRPRAVVHQDEVRDIDRQQSSPRRTDARRGCRCRNPSSRRSRASATDVPMRRHLLGELGQRRVALGSSLRQRMIRRDRHEGGAEQRIRPRRIDLELAIAPRAQSSCRAPSAPACLPSGRSSSPASGAPSPASLSSVAQRFEQLLANTP